MLYTNLKHIESAVAHAEIINANEDVMVICGRMEPMCVSVYRIAEELEDEYKHVKFFDMEFDNPESHFIRSLTEIHGFTGIPFTIYYKKGNIVKTTFGIQSKAQIISVLDKEFIATVSA